jgi:S1-C subfamily serine protease
MRQWYKSQIVCRFISVLWVFFGVISVANHASASVDWEKASKAVVKIYNVSRWSAGSLDARSPEGTDIKVPIAIPRMGHGSGIILTDQCLIATNTHVVEGAIALAVKLEELDFSFPARVVATFPKQDIAFILIDTPICESYRIAALEPRASALARGDEIIVLGYPLDVTATSASLTRGAFSRYADNPDIGRLLQTDAAINPGNSGGPAFDNEGDFLGISVARRANAEGMNYIIPAQNILAHIDDASSSESNADAAIRLRSINEGLYEMVARIAVEMIEKGALTSKEGFAALSDIFIPWIERLEDFELFAGSDFSPEVDLMIAGMFWDMGIASFMHSDATRSQQHLEKAMQLISRAVGQQPDLRANEFVQAVTSFRDPRVSTAATQGNGSKKTSKKENGKWLIGKMLWPELEVGFGILLASQVPPYVSRTQPLQLAAGLNFPLYQIDWFSNGVGLRLDYVGLMTKDPDNQLKLKVSHVISPEIVWQGRAELGKVDLFFEPSLMLSASQATLSGDFAFKPGADIQLGILIVDWVRLSAGVKVLSVLDDTAFMPTLMIGVQPSVLIAQSRRGSRGR